ncbi:mCG125120, isoform CRA_c, partial [Mus musculus]
TETRSIATNNWSSDHTEVSLSRGKGSKEKKKKKRQVSKQASKHRSTLSWRPTPSLCLPKMCQSEKHPGPELQAAAKWLYFPQLALWRRLGQLSCMSRPALNLRSWLLTILHYLLPFRVLGPHSQVGWRPLSRVSVNRPPGHDPP